MAAGSKLGSAILNLRNRGDDAECVARDPEFKKLGFDWDPFTTELNKRIFPASEIYKLENGHCKVPPDFIVTSTKPWPESLHGYKFGVAFAALRLRSGKFAFAVRNVDQLTSVGLRMNVITREWDERVEPMLATFQELNGHRNVPIDFVVPSEAPWKTADWGIELGKLKRKEKPL